MAAWLYEGMLLFAVVFVAGWLFSALAQMRSGMDPRRGLLQGFLFVVFGIYFTWFWSKGQTLAMKTWHVRVVRHDGAPLSQARAAWRYLLAWLWFAPPLVITLPLGLPAAEVAGLVGVWVVMWALLSRLHPQGQFWHDALARTRLVNSASPERGKQLTAARHEAR